MKISALVVKQWLKPEWDKTKFEPIPPRRKPEPQFYLFSIRAYLLKKLTGIYRRDPLKPPSEDMGIQRRHMPERSAEILRYIQDGFPLSRIDRRKLVDQSEVKTLQMPGWLPTAVVINILTDSDKRGPKSRKVAPDDLVKVNYQDGSSSAEIDLPKNCGMPDWEPLVHPIEVIDGQHRLWALEKPEEEEDQWSEELKKRINEIEIPVVAFYGLDRTWQAYLFYTINQLAKRIDISMVFDLYPLLRTEEWLLRFEGPNIYRETRAQDLTILLWAHPESPWKDRIIRLGGRERGKVAQAAFVRSLTASLIKSWQGGTRTRIGGIFGSLRGSHETFLNWGREQQAAFLIMAWCELKDAVMASKSAWAVTLLQKYLGAQDTEKGDLKEKLFSGPDTLLGSDQGIRGFHYVLNDLLWIAQEKDEIDLRGWDWDRKPKFDDNQAISDALKSLKAITSIVKFTRSICLPLGDFDWRLPSALSPYDPQYSTQASYRGSSGYREIRRNLIVHLRDKASEPISKFASEVIEALRYESEEES